MDKMGYRQYAFWGFIICQLQIVSFMSWDLEKLNFTHYKNF